MLASLIFFLISFIISVIFIPIIIKYSNKKQLFDTPDGRKLHTRKICRFGGLAIFTGFLPVYFFIIKTNEFDFNVYIYTLAIIIIFLTGFIDDCRHVSAIYKLLLQVISAVLVVSSGLYVKEIPLFGFYIISFFPVNSVFTVVLIVAFINAINLIDGMDGLASGVVLITLFFLFIISMITNNNSSLLIIASLTGAILGFYFFNFPPAKIFMGDGGAYLLGFMYATISLMGVKKTSAYTLFIIPLMLLFIPLIDIISVMLKRIRQGNHIFTPDKNHLHHRLLNVGMTFKSILFVIYSYTIILGLSSILMIFLNVKHAYLLFMLLFLLIFISSYMLKKFEDFVEEKNNEIRKLKTGSRKN